MIFFNKGSLKSSGAILNFDPTESFLGKIPLAGYNLYLYRSRSLRRLIANKAYTPEINTWNTLVEIGLINASDSAAREEYSNEGRIVSFRPVLDGEDQRVSVMLGWVGEF